MFLRRLDDFTANNSTAKFQKGNMKDAKDKMDAILRDMPQYTEMLSRYSLHLNLINSAYGVFQNKNLKQVGDSEQSIATGVNSAGDGLSSNEVFSLAIKEMASPTLDPTDILRLAIITLSSMNLSDQNYNSLKAKITSQADTRVLENLIYLNLKSDGSSKHRSSDEDKKVSKTMAKNSKFDLDRYAPKLWFLLDQIYSGRLSTGQYLVEKYPGGGGAPNKKLLSSDLVAFKTNKISKGSEPISSKDKLIVFFIGGMSYSEIRVVRDSGSLKVLH